MSTVFYPYKSSLIEKGVQEVPETRAQSLNVVRFEQPATSTSPSSSGSFIEFDNYEVSVADGSDNLTLNAAFFLSHDGTTKNFNIEEDDFSVAASRGSSCSLALEDFPPDDVYTRMSQIEELAVLVSKLPSGSGSKIYDFSRDNLKLSHLLQPRGYFEFSQTEPAMNDNHGSFCDDMNCQQCSSHELLRKFKTEILPRDEFLHLLEFRNIKDLGTSKVFLCQFCHGRKWIPIEKHILHLNLAHGIIQERDHFVMTPHPKLLYQHLTSKGCRYTSCQCGTCKQWFSLSLEKQSEFGGLFEPFFRHSRWCFHIPTGEMKEFLDDVKNVKDIDFHD